MREVTRSALVTQTQDRMYALITDVESYPDFLPWCTHAHVQSRTEGEIVATLGVKRGPLHAEFTTRTEMQPHGQIRIHLVRGPFRVFEGEWLLKPIGAEGKAGTRVELTMRFAFANRLTAMVFEPLFEETAASLVDAFVERARSLDV
jgi:ribosome-associated toxin RatA of RatAB toxin-antitoxin module